MQKFITIIFIVILLGALVYGGMKLVRSYAASANRDQLVSTLYDLGVDVEKYFNAPPSKGRSGKSFAGWKLPATLNKTEYGIFASISNEKRVDICAVGNQTGRNGFTPVRVTARIDSVGIQVTIVN